VKCGQSAKNDGVAVEVDHIVPVAKGGTNDIENLQTLCRNCNQGKKDKT
jgi:5-methylcytosine-specific restriction endonuclease McrA